MTRLARSSPVASKLYLVSLILLLLLHVHAFLVPTRTQRNSQPLMGIKGFRGWLESTFPLSVQDIPKDGIDGVQEEFDHVLIDMNQLLHVVLRKSRNDGHGLTLLMKELDACVALASPTQSLVLAVDGAPSAAKLATQRKRRFATVVKTDFKVKQLEKIEAKKAAANKKNSKSAKAAARKKSRALSETRTLCITPATDFMRSAEQAMLYWAWQRLSSRNHTLANNNVKVFISPSTVAGEGEVKLLEWIYSKNRRGESIAIIGGDSDLVLEGLVVPPSSSHNVFILLPEGSKRYLSVSIWEITRTLHRMLPHASLEATPKLRTDLVLLLILNGNDYLPKLRGSSGFSKLFHSYLRMQREWHKEGRAEQAYLVDPDSLEFNLDFCLAFFGRMASMAPRNMKVRDRRAASDKTSSMQQLNNYVDAGYIPGPVKFRVVRGEDDIDGLEEKVTDTDDDDLDDDDDNDDNDDDDNDDDASDEDRVRVRLLLGEPGSEDFYTYEIWYRRNVSLKPAKHKLASMALEELMDDSDEEGGDFDEGELSGLSNFGYAWEVQCVAEGKVDRYLYGILWNLQTYQDGICSDYGFNYGKRLSPSAKDIVKFLEVAKREQRTLGPHDLWGRPFTSPVAAGVSCLAALPSPVKNLVPEPYRRLPDDAVEEIYASCMDPEDNVFDIKRFEQLCEERVAALTDLPENRKPPDESEYLGTNFWTLLSKVQRPLARPFDPPAPFSDRLSKLRSNNRLRISRFDATSVPRRRSAWKSNETDSQLGPHSIVHSEVGAFLEQHTTIEQVGYKAAYQKRKESRGLRKKQIKMTLKVKNTESVSRERDAYVVSEANGVKKETHASASSKQSNVQAAPARPSTTADGLTAMAALKQLEDAGILVLDWEVDLPQDSQSERIQLSVGNGPDARVLKEDLTYLQERQLGLVSRQSVKQELASLALRDIAEPSKSWSKLSYKDLKRHLQNR